MEYKTVAASSLRELDLQVSQHLQDGWRISGNAYGMNNMHYRPITKGDYRSKKKK